MLLTRRILCLALAPLLALLFPACSLRRDGAYTPTGKSRICEDGGGIDEAASRQRFLGLRRDDSLQRERAAMAEERWGDPAAVPSKKELRAARAMLRMEAEAMVKGNEQIRVTPTGASSDPTSIKFVEAPGVLGLDLAAADDCNSLDGTPNAVMLVVYQLSDKMEFTRLAASQEGLVKLLEAKPFDESVKSVRHFFIQPGDKKFLQLDRPENGRFVALVAGYHSLHQNTSARVYSYGIGRYSSPGESYTSRAKYMFFPMPLHLNVTFGAESLSVHESERVFQSARHSVKLTPLEYYRYVHAPSATDWNVTDAFLPGM